MAKKQAKKQTKKQTQKPTQSKLQRIFIVSWVLQIWRWARSRVSGLLKRRPHRSFRLTRRRDYKRSLAMPGYWSFTNQVRAILWKNWRLFGGLILVYMFVSIAVSGFGAQESYNNLSEALKSTSGDLFKGNFGAIGGAGLLLLTTVTSGLSPDLTQAQTILGGLAVFFGWLATIWLLRNTLAGHNPKLRDGLYNSGSPVLASLIVGFIITLQLLPGAIAIIIYSAAQTSGLLDGGVSAMLVWSSIVLLGLLSLYWISGSFIAMVVVTLPGMYPWSAIRSAGDLVVGRRLRVLYRMLWLLLVLVITWSVIVIPVILFNDWLTQMVPSITWLPLVPLVVIGMGSLTLIYVTAYVYLMYRRIVDDDAGPA
jgi:hypothetical protein